MTSTTRVVTSAGLRSVIYLVAFVALCYGAYVGFSNAPSLSEVSKWADLSLIIALLMFLFGPAYFYFNVWKKTGLDEIWNGRKMSDRRILTISLFAVCLSLLMVLFGLYVDFWYHKLNPILDTSISIFTLTIPLAMFLVIIIGLIYDGYQTKMFKYLDN